MKSIYTIYLLAIMFLACSCESVETEIRINKRGKGNIELSFDMASFLRYSSIGMKASASDTEDKTISSLLNEAMLKMYENGMIQNFDTIITDANYKNFSCRFTGDSDAGTAFIKVTMPFNNPNEFMTLFDNELLQKELFSNQNLMGFEIINGEFNKKEKILKLPFILYEDAVPDSLNYEDHLDNTYPLLMFKSQIGNAITRVHLDKKIIASNSPKAIIQGNSVEFERPILECIFQKSDQREIMFK